MNTLPSTDVAPANAAGPAPVAVLDDLEQARLLLDPDRARLVDALRRRPDSAAGLARRLGDSRQRLNHHLRTLESAGLVELHEERRRGNCTERVLRVIARRFVVDPAALEGSPAGTGAGAAAAGEKLSATWLVALAVRAIHEVADLLKRAGDEGKRLATWSLDTDLRVGSPAAMAAFTEDLTAAVAEVIARHHDPGEGSRPFRLVVGSYPAPGPAEGGAAQGDEPDTDHREEVRGR